MRFCKRDESNPDCDQKKREKLAVGEWADERRVRFAEVFDNDPEDGVANKKKTGQHAVWLPRSRTHEPQDAKENDAFEKGLVKLRWMAEH